jgi:hypothetical protein
MVRIMINNRLVPLHGEDLTRYLKSISANEIATIELITNPSAAYDAEGDAGLINIVIRQNKKDTLTALHDLYNHTGT